MSTMVPESSGLARFGARGPRFWSVVAASPTVFETIELLSVSHLPPRAIHS